MPIIDNKKTLKLAFLLCGAGPGGVSSIRTVWKCRFLGTCLAATCAGACAEAGASLPATDARKRASGMMLIKRVMTK
jgi:hypothetical protein